jgi:phage terminase large subunit
VREVESRYLPHPKQVRFHRAKELYRLFLAGIGTGKTLAGVHECISMSLQNPQCDGCIVEPTFPMIRDVMLPVWKEWVDNSIWTYKKSEQKIVLWTGQNIFLRSAENPERIRGLNLAWAWGDELAQVPTADVWRILQGRIRDPRARRRGLFATTTPKGWNWLAKLFVNATSPTYRWIKARTSDNPYLPSDFVQGLRDDYGEEFARQELDADILELQGLVWPISPGVHCRWDTESARGRIKEWFGGIDWGYSAPSALVVGGRDEEGTWYLFEEWRKPRQLTEDIIEQMKSFSRKYRIHHWYADSAEPDRIKEVKNAGFACRPADKRRGAGIADVRSLLAVRGSTGRPRLHISPKMKWWLKEQEEFHYVEDTEDTIGENGDHLMDATRYMVHSVLNRRQIKGRVAA